MDIKQNKISDYSLEIEFTFTNEDIEKHFDKAAKQISKDVKIDGFREGKAPKNIIEQKFGKDIIFEEASKITFQENYVDYVIKNNLEIISAPEVSLQKLIPNKEATFKAVVSIVPELQLPDYKKIGKEASKEKKEVKIEEKEIKDTVEYLLNSRSTFVDNEKVEDGNIVELDYTLKVEDKEIDKKESARMVFGKNVPFEELNKELKDLKQNDKKEIKVSLKEDFEQKDFANKEAILNFEIKKILRKEVPKLTDEFVKENFQSENIKAFEDKLKENLLKEKQAKEDQRIRLLALTNIRKEIKEDLPKELTQREVKSMVNDLEARVKQIGLKFEDYLKQINKKVEDLEKEFEPAAKNKVFDSLILRQIKKLENIDVSDKEVEEKANELFEMVKAQNPDIKDMESVNKQALYSYAKEILLNTKIFDFILNK